MVIKNPYLLADIERFLSDTGMGEMYFGKASVGNSELVPRLRRGGRVWPETEAKARSFMKERRDMARPLKDISSNADNQGAHTN